MIERQQRSNNPRSKTAEVSEEDVVVRCCTRTVQFCLRQTDDPDERFLAHHLAGRLHANEWPSTILLLTCGCETRAAPLKQTHNPSDPDCV